METNYYLQSSHGGKNTSGCLPLPAAIKEDQIEVEGWELEALEESLVCYKPTREICGVGTVTAVSRSLQKGEMIIYTRNEKAMMCVQTKIFILS